MKHRRTSSFMAIASVSTLVWLALSAGAHIAIIQAVDPSSGTGHVGNSSYQIATEGQFVDSDPTPHSEVQTEIYSNINGGGWTKKGTNSSFAYHTWTVSNQGSSATVYWMGAAVAWYPATSTISYAYSGTLGPYYTP